MTGIREFLTTAARHVFFTGKGGVGKTSLAYASAVLLGDRPFAIAAVKSGSGRF